MDVAIKILKSLFEIRIEIINLTLLFNIAFYLGLFVKKKSVRLFISLFFSLFFSLQLISLYFVGTFIGYQFYIHFNVRDITEMMSIYLSQIALLIFIISLLSVVFYRSRNISLYISKFLIRRIPKFIKIQPRSFLKYSSIAILLASVYFMNVNKGLIRSSIELISMLKVKKQDLSKTLKELGIEKFTPPELLEVSKGKNVIIISLESFERSYLEGEFSYLTPNLNRLKKEWNYYGMEQNSGSEWTSGSLYTSITGLPAYFGVHGNTIFQKAYHTNITGITHVFEKAGYNMTYITSSNAEFSGTEDLLHTFKVKKIIDQSLLGKQFRDKDLFEKAKKTVKEYHNTKKPFTLFLSTFDTHFPDGIYDERMESIISPKSNNQNFMIASVDYMIGNFIEYLQKENLLSNTVVYIFPDHLKMGSSIALNNNQKRSLYLITNALDEDLTTSKKLYQLDLPNIILDGAQVKHNAHFLTDWIADDDKNKFIKDHIQEITSLNTAGILRLDTPTYKPLTLSKDYNAYKKDTARFIAHAGGKIDNHTYTNSLEALNNSYQNGLRLFELDIIETKDGEFVAAHDWQFWSEITGYTESLPPTKKDFLTHPIRGKYTPMDMKLINQWFKEHSDAVLVTDKVNKPKAFSEKFIDKNRLMMELFSWNAVEEATKINIKSAIVSENVLKDLGGKALQKLKKKGIKTVAISQNFIKENIDLLKEFKENDIKVYVFNINYGFDAGKDYFVKYELDQVYGIYTDSWTFTSE